MLRARLEGSRRPADATSFSSEANPGSARPASPPSWPHELHDDGALVLGGRCDEDMGVPYQPFVEALRHYVTHAAATAPARPPRRRTRPSRPRADASGRPACPSRCGPTPRPSGTGSSTPSPAGWRTFSVETPVLLVLDDLQWAAKPTLLLLRHLLRAADPARLAGDGDLPRHRPSVGPPLGEFLADLSRLEDAERLSVTGLDADGVAAFLEAAAGHDLDAEGVAAGRSGLAGDRGQLLLRGRGAAASRPNRERSRSGTVGGSFHARRVRFPSRKACATSSPGAWPAFPRTRTGARRCFGGRSRVRRRGGAGRRRVRRGQRGRRPRGGDRRAADRRTAVRAGPAIASPTPLSARLSTNAWARPAASRCIGARPKRSR